MKQQYEILAEGLAFPEGPAFAADGALWGVEIKGESLWRYADGVLERIIVGGVPNGITISRSGEICFCDAGNMAVRAYNPRTGECRTLVDNLAGKPLGKPNDLAFDAAGNLLFTCPNDGRTEPPGYFCVLTPEGNLTVVRDGMYFCNGLGFASDGETLIVAETYRHRLWKGRWDASARQWLEPQPWVEVGGPIGPDGFAFGADGNLYVAVYGSGRIKVVSPQGQIIDELPLPGQNPTNCAFDPSGKLGLVVTEAEKGLLVSIGGIGPGIKLFD